MLLKVCCIASTAEAKTAARLGADYIGLVGPMPSGAGVITLASAQGIAAAAPRTTKTVLLTSSETLEDIRRDIDEVKPQAVQLVRHVPPAVIVALRGLLPVLTLIQVIHVENDASVRLARDYGPLVDMLLLDSGRPSAPVAELGGTGRTHDWDLSRRIVAESPVPALLAGGLNPDNVGHAIRAVRPAGIDVCSGLRSPSGALQEDRLAAFVTAIRAAV